jgi:Imelysin
MRRLHPLLALLLVILITACGQQAAPSSPVAPASPATQIAAADLGVIKQYLLEKSATLKGNTHRLQQLSNEYYALADEASFDYQVLAEQAPEHAAPLLRDTRAAWIAASPEYERIEGIVAAVLVLEEFDVILDSGSSGAERGEHVVPFDLLLTDGTVLSKPGNLFGVTESTLWGTEPAFSSGVAADIDGNGIGFGDVLPNARILKAAAEALDRSVGDLERAAQVWEPSEAEAFTILVTMIPTMSEYFESWEKSRFVAGEASTQRDFVVISRLSDILDIIGSLQVVYQGVSPMIASVDPDENEQIGLQLSGLRTFIADIYAQEQSGKRFTAEEANLLGTEAQNRAIALTDRITRVAARLHIVLG